VALRDASRSFRVLAVNRNQRQSALSPTSAWSRLSLGSTFRQPKLNF
jgi:hypothetical protein